jgi:pimeloyl-ACP methyl ester carboxylesterase
MKIIKILTLLLNFSALVTYAQNAIPLPNLVIDTVQSIPLEANNLIANQVYMSLEKLEGKNVVKVIKDSTVKAVDEATFVRIKNLNFKEGIIEVKVLSRLTQTASPTARGFIGVAYRINADNSKFECMYLRPTNGRTEDQVRRNHSIQYFSFPDFKFPRLRKESPEMYESHADMGLNEWIPIKIVVKGKTAQLFLNNNKQPALVVNDLKWGENNAGALGLFVDVGTEGYFKDLKVTPFPNAVAPKVNSPEKDRYFTTSDGVRLHYQVSGTGQPLVIFPGYGQDATKFAQVYKALESQFTIYCLDYRWHGKSDVPAYGYHIERLAKDAKEMIEDAQIETFHLFGHSMGNSVAWCYFSMFGMGKILKYVLGDEAPCFISDPFWTDKEVETFTGSPQRRELFKVFRPTTKPESMSLQQDMMSRLLTDHLARDWRDVIPNIKVPTMIVMGGKSHFASPLLWDWLQKNIQGSRLEIIKEGGHGFYESHPDIFNALLIDFLKK